MKGSYTMRAGNQQPPAVLPCITVRILDPGDSRALVGDSASDAPGGWCTVTLDTPVSASSARKTGHPPAARAVSAAQLRAVLAGLAEEARTAVRVEIHEPDGTIRSDILTPPESCGEAPRVLSACDHTAAGVVARGFHPGEPVLIACVVRIAPADSHGRLPLPLGPTPTTVPQDAQWILVGRTSKAVASHPASIA